MKKLLCLLISFIGVYHANAQTLDTLTVMQYNLLYYGNINTPSGVCTEGNNSTSSKNQWLQTIVQHEQPDLILANEITTSTSGLVGLNVLNLRNNALNVNGETKWNFVNPTNNSNSSIINGVFFNQNKLGFLSQSVINHPLRDINLVRFYYKSPALAFGADTIKLGVIVVHYKAGSLTSDEAERLSQANAIMSALANETPGNFILGGDLNIQSSNASSYQALINNSNPQIRLRDPVNFNGTWNNSALFAPLHTQSTSTSGGCKASGGLDDRFDFLLANNYVMGDSLGIRYIPGSYKISGQDGARLNSSINSPTNNSAPASVISALAGLSDHLPVSMKLRVFDPASVSGTSVENQLSHRPLHIFSARLHQSGFEASVQLSKTGIHTIQILDSYGRLVHESYPFFDKEFTEFSIQNNFPSSGVYILRIYSPDNQRATYKLIKI